MSKRSLNPRDNDANKIEQLNHAVDALLARSDGKPPQVEASVEPLVQIAADLHDLPREEFKTRLQSELLDGRKTMSTVAEPITSARPAAVPRLTFKDAAKAINLDWRLSRYARRRVAGRRPFQSRDAREFTRHDGAECC